MRILFRKHQAMKQLGLPIILHEKSSYIIILVVIDISTLLSP